MKRADAGRGEPRRGAGGHGVQAPACAWRGSEERGVHRLGKKGSGRGVDAICGPRLNDRWDRPEWRRNGPVDQVYIEAKWWGPQLLLFGVDPWDPTGGTRLS